MLIADPLMLETVLLTAAEPALSFSSCHIIISSELNFFFAGEHTADILWGT